MASKIYDISVIGGGPIGLFTAGAAGEQGAICNLIESRLHLGGIMMAAYPDKDVYNFPGVQIIKGRDLINDLIHKCKAFGVVTRLGEYVNDIRNVNRSTIAIKTNKGEYLSSTVIIATGLKAQYSPLTEFLNIGDWNGSGIYESWPRPEAIKGKRVAIIGNSETEPKIPDDFRPVSAEFIWLLNDLKKGQRDLDGEIIRYPWKLREISGHKIPDCMIIRNETSGEERSIAIDAVISLVDLQPRQTLYYNFGIQMTGPRINVDQRMQTSVKRVYAVGDIANYPGKIMLLSAGIYEARIAVKNALKII